MRKTVVLVAVVCLAFAGGAMVAVELPVQEPAAEVIRTRELRIVDEAGRDRIVLSTSGEFAFIHVLNQEAADRSELRLCEPSGNGGAALILRDGDTAMLLRGPGDMVAITSSSKNIR